MPKRLILPAIVAAAVTAGCSVGGTASPAPPTNAAVALIAARRAADDLRLPAGEGRTVRLDMEDGAADPARRAVMAALIGNGWRIAGDAADTLVASVRVFRVSIVTGSSRGEVSRTAEARFDVALRRGDGTRSAFNGRGVVEDRFLRMYLPAVRTGEPYEEIEAPGLGARIKPILIGVAVTIFGWALYSYRG